MNIFVKAPLVALLLGLCAVAGAQRSEGAVKFITGGASDEAIAALNQQAAAYSLKLLFAAKGSGAYLADVQVTVHALPSRDVVLETRTEGPLLLAALPAGRYQLTATYADVTPGSPNSMTRTLVVPRSGQLSQVVYFSTGDLVGTQ
jgi:hypothetical protein